MNSKSVFSIFFIFFLFSFSSIAGVDNFIPTAKISMVINQETLEIESVDSKKSIDNLNNNLTSVWYLYNITNPSGKNFKELKPTLLNYFDNDLELNEELRKLDFGLYSVVLTVTNLHGISNSSSQYFIISHQDFRHALFAGKITKKVLTELISSCQNGWVGSYMRTFLSKNAYDKIMNNVIPKLKKLSIQAEIFTGQITTAITDGLIEAGLSPSMARRLATYITVVF